MSIFLPQLSNDCSYFPPLNQALFDPDGLLAMGGDLTPTRIVNAYRNGIFPWFSDGEPILWWSPSKRATLSPMDCHISKSMQRLINKETFTITVNQDFCSVIKACAQPRKTQAETWINKEMIAAYIDLHQKGIAHSIEVWQSGELVGGLYGVCVGTIFCGESMFSLVSNSSKIAFVALNKQFKKFKGDLIDCQMQTDHLQTLGVQECSRQQFIEKINTYRNKHLLNGCWEKQEIQIV